MLLYCITTDHADDILTCSQFDLVVVNDPVDTATQDYLHEKLMEHTLNLSISDHLEPLLDLPDLQQYLSVASAIDVELGDSAAKLLQAFYVASRKVRISISYGTDIPIRALNSL